MSSKERLRILLVDDNLDIINVLKRGLASLGMDVTTFSDPEAALAGFKPGQYDAIVLDVRMPKMTGFEVARGIWKQEPKASICFLTAFEIFRKEAEKIFPSLKSYCFVKKPIQASELAAHIRLHLQHKLEENC